jgi:hypothetical protein
MRCTVPEQLSLSSSHTDCGPTPTGAFHRCFGFGIFLIKARGPIPTSRAIRTSSSESRHNLFAFTHSSFSLSLFIGTPHLPGGVPERKGTCLLGRRQAALREPPQETWFLSMLVLKLADVGLDFGRAPRAEPQIPEVFEELDGLIVIARTLGGNKCVHLGPRVRLALSESGKILLTSRCRLALAPGAFPRLALRFLTVPLLTMSFGECQQVRHGAWLRRRARRVGTLTRGSKATQQLRTDVRLTFSY